MPPFEKVFAKNSVATTATDGVANVQWSTSGVVADTVPLPARIVGMSVKAALALTSGTLTAKAQRSESNIAGLSLSLATGEQRKSVWWGWDAGFPIATTDTLAVVMDTNVMVPNGTGQNVLVTRYMQMPMPQ